MSKYAESLAKKYANVHGTVGVTACASAIDEALEDVCKAVCTRCDKGEIPVRDEGNGIWYHRRFDIPCPATPIRSMMKGSK